MKIRSVHTVTVVIAPGVNSDHAFDNRDDARAFIEIVRAEGVLATLSSNPIHTLENQLVAYRAARNLFPRKDAA